MSNNTNNVLRSKVAIKTESAAEALAALHQTLNDLFQFLARFDGAYTGYVVDIEQGISRLLLELAMSARSALQVPDMPNIDEMVTIGESCADFLEASVLEKDAFRLLEMLRDLQCARDDLTRRRKI